MDNTPFLLDDIGEDSHHYFINDCESFSDQEISKSNFDSFPYLSAQKTIFVNLQLRKGGNSSLNRDIGGSKHKDVKNATS